MKNQNEMLQLVKQVQALAENGLHFAENDFDLDRYQILEEISLRMLSLVTGLPAETIAEDMQARIPLGENLSMLAGLLGAWPIAVSTYLASKIFADQVEDFTTIIYRLEGTWENPQAGFEAPSEEVNE